jgi:hypothetical protein
MRSDREVAGKPVKVTNWHELDYANVNEKLGELNKRLQDHGLRTRFRIVRDEFGWDVIVDDGGRLEFVETVEEVEIIVEELLGGG